MNALNIRSTAAILVACGLHAHVEAARISEPGTVLYGRIRETAGAATTTLTSGNLVWRIAAVGPGGTTRTNTFTTILSPFGNNPDDPLSYRLKIPHELLAHDLSVRARAVPIGAVPTRITHISIHLDGRLLEIDPLVATGFQVDQLTRASTKQINLTLETGGADSDGDGYLDAWEDANGYDKWDPGDAPMGSNTGGGGGSGGAAAQARTFGEWRQAHFPGTSGDLDAFGELDADSDGLVNLLEYAFDLNPTVADATQPGVLPQSHSSEGRQGIAFRRRAQATDLEYAVEVSPDLQQWSDGNDLLDPLPITATETRTRLVEKPASEEHSLRFFRVVVRRQ